jgi:2-oxoglutarate dehydrogenase E2 component (dihydrolipoamide succinyltransferase)
MPVEVKIPQLGESVTEAEIVRWLKADGDQVAVDEPLAEIETDKATAELPAPSGGVLEIVVAEGSTVKPGDVVARIHEGKAKAAQPPAKETPAQTPRETTQEAAAGSRADGGNGGEKLSPAVRRLVDENRLDPHGISATGPGGRLTKQDVLAHLQEGKPATVRPDEANARADVGSDRVPSEPTVEREDKGARLSLVRGPVPTSETGAPAAPAPSSEPEEERVRMSRLRRSIAQRLVEAQQTAAILTTFNEVDMSRVMDWRARFKDKFAQTHGVTLGFMSFFARACVLALKEIPVVNARIEGDEIVYNQRVHLGIAASTDRGLVVPVIRYAETLAMADLEREIGRLAELARTGRIGLEDLTGGTFTISNGGVFGSLMSTPILNPPQSAILGMHKIQKRAVVVEDQIVVRPMMYLALSYDHRLIDGREAVTFLVRVKERLEDPERLLLEI